MVADSQVFEKEKLMYETILPTLESISGTTLAPKCYFIQEEGIKLIVFNDLKELGFEMIDRKAGMDFDHCKLLIERMAIFHASSIAFMKDREEFEELKQGMSSDPILVEFVYKPNLNRLIEVAEKWTEEEFEDLNGILKKILDNYLEIYKMPMKTDSDLFRVINHGDAWCNNFMFAYDANKKPIDVLFVSLS